MIRVALVAIGGYGKELADRLLPAAEKGLCKLVGAADTRLADLGQQAEVLRSAGAELYTDAIEMFDALQGKCDAVFIASGISSHASLFCAAVERGYHVHLEKPPAATVQEMDRMQAAVDGAGVLCQVGFQATWSQSVRFIHERVASGRLGRIETAACRAGWPRDTSYYQRNEWAGKLRSGGSWVLDGPAINALSHQVTNLLLMCSPNENEYCTPAKVRAELYVAGPVESHDTAAIEIHTAEGPRLYWLGSHASETQFGPILELRGERGRATYGVRDGATVTCDDGTEERCGGGPGPVRDSMVEGFLQVIETGDGSSIRCRLGDGRKFVLALDGAHESSEAVRRIDASFTKRLDEGDDQARTAVIGLDDAINRAAERHVLFSDLDDAPAWAVKTEAYDLRNYRSFPQRFACE